VLRWTPARPPMRHDEPVAKDERSQDRHKRPTVGLRLPEKLDARLRAYAEATGQSRHALIVRWVQEGLEREANSQVNKIRRPVGAETGSVEVTREITYEHPYTIRTLIRLLEEEGVHVELQAPPLYALYDRIDFSTDIQQLVVTLAAVGSLAAMKAGVAKFRKLIPHAKVTIEGEDDDEGAAPQDTPDETPG
jgi:predicted transcriptional regulator